MANQIRTKSETDPCRNFSAQLNISKHDTPFNQLCNAAGMDRTVYFRMMIDEEKLTGRILKRIRPEYKDPKAFSKVFK